jgi:hypothetical protein
MAEVNLPCVQFPKLPQVPNITLPGSVELSGFLDFSAGMPTDCSVTFNLMGQLAPVLASLAPILNILGVLKALADFATNPLMKGPDLIAAIGKLSKLFLALTPAGIAITIKGVLSLIINFLSCFISQLEAAVKFQADIALIQQGLGSDTSPVLLASLSCAQANAEIVMQQTMGSLGPIAPLLSVVNIIGGIAGLTIEMPAIDVSAGGDITGAISSLHQAIDSLKAVLDSLPV